ncbi:MAG: TGS domain-containing protein [Nitrospiraceae bacterium]|nr:MAG: TGS domain-containing protein [Nitrospiraceae bacterium]
MPANLPPEYYTAELRFKQATIPQEKILALEELISTVPKHKGTDKLRADLRRRLSKLRDESLKKKKSGKGDLYTVEKHGASQAALVGFANSGKSSVLAAITNAHPVIADFPMSTVMPLSGMMPFEDIQFQIIDLPPVGNDSTDGWVSGILRSAHMLILVVDSCNDPKTQTELLLDQLKIWKIPLMKTGEDTSQAGSLRPKPAVIIVNKTDTGGRAPEMTDMKRMYGAHFPVVSFSALKKKGINELKNVLFTSSGIIRVYSKEPGKEPDMDSPFTLPYGSNVLNLAHIIHKDFVRSLKYACIWGSAKFEGQRVQKDYLLHDRDIVEYHIR